MKEFTVIVRNRNTGELKSLDVKAENFVKAISQATRKACSNGNFEVMYHREKTLNKSSKK